MIRHFKAAAEAKVARELRTATGQRRRVLAQMMSQEPGQGMLWSFDNPNIHSLEELEAIGISPADRAELPAASGDMHRVIEHVHGTLTTHLQSYIAHARPLPAPAKVQDHLRSLFFSKITISHVNDDLDLLPGLWRAIKAAGGAYVDYQWR